MGTAENARSFENNAHEAGRKVAREASEKAREVGETIRDQVGEVYESGSKLVRGAADKARGVAEDAYDVAYDAGEQALKKVKGGVQKEPLMSLGIALGVGFVGGILFARR